MDKDKKILIFLLTVWVAALAYYFIDTGGGGGKDAATLSGRSDLGAGEGGDGMVAQVRLGLLAGKRPPYGKIKKDIFKPLKIFVPLKPVPPEPKPPEPKPPEPVSPPIKPPEPVPPTALEVFTSSVKFVGFMEKDWDKTVFLSKGEEIFLVRVGDVLEGRMRIAEITEVQMTFHDDRTGEISTIDISSEE